VPLVPRLCHAPHININENWKLYEDCDGVVQPLNRPGKLDVT
jgi:hypothetical protein